MRSKRKIGRKYLALAGALAFLWGWGLPAPDLPFAADTEEAGGGAVGNVTSPVSPAPVKPAPKTAPGAKSKKKAVGQQKAPAQAPAPGGDAIVSPGGTDGLVLPSAVRRQYTGKPISLDLLDADLRNVLRLLSDLTGTNIVIEPDVTGRVTLKVEQVPWDQVLDMVLSMNDLGKEQVGSVIRVAKQGKLRQEWNQQAESIKAKQDLIESSKDLGELTTVYLAVSFAKPSDLATKINEAKSERGKVAVDDRTSVIIYSDYPARIVNARQLIGRLDRPTPQVLIEARIITLNRDTIKTLGVHFNMAFHHQTTPSPPVRDFVINGAEQALPVFGTVLSTLIGKTLVDVDLEISALETASELRIVAAPRVMTLDNKKATITQGTQVPYLTLSADQPVASNVFSTQFKDAVLELQVTPHITPDRKVLLAIEAKQDTVSTQLFGQQQQPGIDTRKIATELLVDDGNIVVIGGVMQNQDTYTLNKTPGLGDIPILGGLFRKNDSRVTKQELLIFISPRIVEVNKPPDRT
jgi:type IV pilus assembly protein PilQ